MKRWLLPVLIAASAGLSMTTMYSVEPRDMASSAFVKVATQEVIAVADTVSASDIFLGAYQNSGDWVVTISDDQGHSSVATVLALSAAEYSFVHFVFPTPLPVRKGTTCQLSVNHSSQQPVTEVFWDTHKYHYGTLSWTGGNKPPPSPSDSYALAARVEGVVYNDPGQLGTADDIPVQTVQFGRDLDMFRTGVENLWDMGFRRTRFGDCWNVVQPSPNPSPDSFDWSRMDAAWVVLATVGVQPHWTPTWSPWWLSANDSFWLPYSTNLFDSVFVDSCGQRVASRSNHNADCKMRASGGSA